MEGSYTAVIRGLFNDNNKLRALYFYFQTLNRLFFKLKTRASRSSLKDITYRRLPQINRNKIEFLPKPTGKTCFKSLRYGTGARKAKVNLQSACFEKLFFNCAFNVRKSKRVAKFEGLEPGRCEDIKGIVAPEKGPKSFKTLRKQALGHTYQFFTLECFEFHLLFEVFIMAHWA